METLWQDLKYAARMLVKKPGFTAVAVLTLALGIGANTAIFSVVNAVLLEPLPFHHPERLMAVWMTGLKGGMANKGHLSYPDFADFRSQNRSLERMAAVNTNDFTLTGSGEPYRMTGAIVSPDLFPLLGVSAEAGRTFTPEEDLPPGVKGNHVVLLSHHLWQQRFGSDPGIVGRRLILNSRSYTVVGVMPASFAFPIQPIPVDLWTTHAVMKETADGSTPMTDERGAHYLTVIGRLKPGVTQAQAQADLSAVAAQLEKQYPDSNANKGCMLVPAHEDLVGDIRPALLVLIGAVSCVLLIACANVANLLLARSTTRQREMAIRTALGAGRKRVMQQLLTESVLLALLGAVGGVLLALWGTDALIALSPADIPRLANARLSIPVLGFTFVVALITGVLFGLAPAFQSTRAALSESLKEGGRGTSEGAAHGRMRGALVVAEMAIALVLLVGAGLAMQSFLRLAAVNPGFDAQRVLTMSIDMPGARYVTNEQIAQTSRQLLTGIEGLHGVRSASMSFPLPLSDNNMGVVFGIEERPLEKTDLPGTALHVVEPGYFRTMGIPLKTGRDFTPEDTLKSPLVVIVNETLAKKYFPNEDPIGKRVQPSINVEPGSKTDPMREIVGVVGDVRFRSLRSETGPEMYGPEAQLPFGELSIVIRADGDPAQVIGAVRETLRRMDPDMPLYEIQPLEHYVAGALAQTRFNSLLLGIFSGVALLLTAIGLYGVTSYSVAQRTQEIGIRVALGAQRADVFRLVVGQGLRQSALGLVLGLGAAFAVTRTMASLLYGVSATDPPTFGGTSLVMLLVTCAACYIPARRATQVDPLVALRYE
jgi:putative ABC transport system permease protein